MLPALKPTILIIDNNPGVQRHVGQILDQHGYAVTSLDDGSAPLEEKLDSSPDLMIIDLTPSELSGTEICGRVRDWYTGSILVLSSTGDVDAIAQALDSGADDYLVKPFRSKELLERIGVLLSRVPNQENGQASIQTGGLHINVDRREVHTSKGLIRLTRTEFDILALLAKNADRVLASETILREVWGPYHGEYAQTLRVHIGHIRKKIEKEPSTPRLIVTETGVGYRFTGSAPDARAAKA